MENEKKNGEVDLFSKGINNLANRGNATTITSWLEEKCKMGHNDVCPYLKVEDGKHICRKVSPNSKQYATSIKCDGVPNLDEYEKGIKELIPDHHSKPAEHEKGIKDLISDHNFYPDGSC